MANTSISYATSTVPLSTIGAGVIAAGVDLLLRGADGSTTTVAVGLGGTTARLVDLRLREADGSITTVVAGLGGTAVRLAVLRLGGGVCTGVGFIVVKCGVFT